MSTNAAALVVLAKQPVPGRVKTRLARTEGEPMAAELYEAFLRDTLSTAATLAGVQRFVACSPPGSQAWFERFDPGAQRLLQREGDLGARLAGIFEDVFALGYSRVVACGSDSPHVTASDLRAAFERCAESALVLGPTLDGGYWCAGLTEWRPGLFEHIPWSTDRVLAATRERAAGLGLEVRELAPTFDVDEASDLDLLRAAIARGAACPASAALL